MLILLRCVKRGHLRSRLLRLNVSPSAPANSPSYAACHLVEERQHFSKRRTSGLGVIRRARIVEKRVKRPFVNAVRKILARALHLLCKSRNRVGNTWIKRCVKAANWALNACNAVFTRGLAVEDDGTCQLRIER